MEETHKITSPIYPQFRTIDGLPILFAESIET